VQKASDQAAKAAEKVKNNAAKGTAVVRSGAATAANKIRSTYRAEKAEDALELVLRDDALTVNIAYCPAVKHLRETGREVSHWFPMTTTVVMETLATAGGLRFEMEAYDPETGAARYRFVKD
jgi:hypothetical protein